MDALNTIDAASSACSALPNSLNFPASSGLDTPVLSPSDRALVNLGQTLKDHGYRFTTITPASHRTVRRRPLQATPTLRDIFGWSRPFGPAALSNDALTYLADAGELELAATRWRSHVRFSTLNDQIFVHSAFPTEDSDAVFFGPDTYRFARMIKQSVSILPARSSLRILDLGAGSGAGGLYAARLLSGRQTTVVLSDINRRALRFCRINAILNGVSDAQIVESDLFDSIDGKFDLIVANPPYLVDPLARLYRHGGGDLGSDLSLKIVAQGIDRLNPGGRLVLYTGSAIVDGEDRLHHRLSALLRGRFVQFSYEEIDPDVFGEELADAPYDKADRIAAVGVTIDFT